MTELSVGCHEGNSFAGVSGLQLYELKPPADGPLSFKRRTNASIGYISQACALWEYLRE